MGNTGSSSKSPSSTQTEPHETNGMKKDYNKYVSKISQSDECPARNTSEVSFHPSFLPKNEPILSV